MNGTDFLLGGSAWWVLPCSLLALGATFGLMPGLLLRLIVLFYPKGHPRREELFGELFAAEMGRMERFEWVFQQLETASRQGLSLRWRQRAERKASAGTSNKLAEDPDTAFQQLDSRFAELRRLADQLDQPARNTQVDATMPSYLEAAVRAWIAEDGEDPHGLPSPR